MKSYLPTLAKSRLISSRISSLLLLFQRTPIVQMLFPEANILGGSSLGKVTLWTVATVTGLGAYDSVAGATAITQLQPNAGSTSVTATVGTNLTFIYQMTGTEAGPKTWEIIGALPPGLTHTNSVGSTVDSITGFPTTAGSYPITIKGWEKAGSTGLSKSQSFTINVNPGATLNPPTILTQTTKVAIPLGTRAALTVRARGLGLRYQWYMGSMGNTSRPIKSATKATYLTPVLTAKKNYWVRVSNTDGFVDSKTIVVSVL